MVLVDGGIDGLVDDNRTYVELKWLYQVVLECGCPYDNRTYVELKYGTRHDELRNILT